MSYNKTVDDLYDEFAHGIVERCREKEMCLAKLRDEFEVRLAGAPVAVQQRINTPAGNVAFILGVMTALDAMHGAASERFGH